MNNSDQQQNIEKFVVYLDPDFADLIPAYLERRQADLVVIQQALTQQDYDKIRVIGHDLKGTGGGYGLDGISEIGQVLELAAKQQDSEQIDSSLQDLTSYLDRLDVQYSAR